MSDNDAEALLRSIALQRAQDYVRPVVDRFVAEGFPADARLTVASSVMKRLVVDRSTAREVTFYGMPVIVDPGLPPGRVALRTSAGSWEFDLA